jgi:hypothetical protein
VNIGGVDPALVAASPTAGFDSWLSVGVDGGDRGGLLGSIGLDFEAWTPDAGLTTDNGAVFWMDPTAAPTERLATVAQITVPTGSAWEVTVNAQGRSPDESRVWNLETGHMEGDWQEEGLVIVSDFADIPSESVLV